jgi:hypothetical protein
MWRTVLAVLLVPSMLWAQEPRLNTDKPETTKQALVHDYHVITELRTMRRGKSEKAVVRLFLLPSYIVSPYEPSRDLVPLKLEFEESDGVAATSFRFDTDRSMHFKFREPAALNELMLQPPGDEEYSISGDPRVPGLGGQSSAHTAAQQDLATLKLFQKSTVRVLIPTFEVAIKVKASKNATIGSHLLRGKITYQPISENGVSPLQEMELALPITVIDKDIITLSNPEYLKDYAPLPDRGSFGKNSKGEQLELILLAPILVPLTILEMIMCGFWGEDCSC